MAAVATRRRRRKAGRISDAPPVGNDAYRVLGPSGEELAVRGYAPLALVLAQEKAMRWEEPDEVTVTVVRQSLFGPPVELYRIVRCEDGVLLTYTINKED